MIMQNDELATWLLRYDGVAVSFLSEARVACQGADGYMRDLIALCADPRAAVSDGATWILKAELDDGACLSAPLTDHLIRHLDQITSWQAALHLCQSLARLTLTESQAENVMVWAQSFADHPRPFLRAWSISARCDLGSRFAACRSDAKAALEAAEADSAASVRARARQIQKATKGN